MIRTPRTYMAGAVVGAAVFAGLFAAGWLIWDVGSYLVETVGMWATMAIAAAAFGACVGLWAAHDGAFDS